MKVLHLRGHMSEKTILNHLQLLASKIGARLFRQNTGSAWQGEVHRLKTGDILIKNPRIVHFGLCKGSGDLIGFAPVKINHSHLNKTLAVFWSVEIKTGSLKPTSDQINWHNMIKNNGGVSVITNKILTEDELKREINI